MSSSPVTFYTVSDARFFLGVVALLNSLRLTGNDGELVVLDYGLTPDQRTRLEPHATVVDVPAELANPVLAKPFPWHLDPTGVVVVIDCDVIVTRSMAHLVDECERGRICVYPVKPGHRERWHREWEELFELRRPLARQPYRSGGCVAFSVERWPEFLRRWWDLATAIPAHRTTQHGAPFSDPLWGAEQDALNVLLMTEIPPEAVADQPEEDAVLEGDLHEVAIVDRRTLECAFRGHTPTMLHYGGGPKPWEKSAWMRVRPNAFALLMTRVLFEPDVPLRLRPDEVPPWLRPGIGSRALLGGLGAMNVAARSVARRAPAPLAARLSLLRGRLGPR